ncbi:PP2C family protein-serine/threonine phosphatase [Streptomyces sp. NPDC048266]|uniref:PP2C family protein-serine/threonine phosphatase n=1 Tax=unclassified Streptomyces TaxID=2593676 RepID=UPI0033EE6CF2
MPDGHRGRPGTAARTQFHLGRALPFLVLALTILLDLITPDRERFDRLLVAAPALAAVTWSVAGTLGIGLLAMVARMVLSLTRNEELVPELIASEIVLAAVTAGAAWASHVRTRYERDLRELTAVAEVVQRVVLRPLPARLGRFDLHLLYVAAAAKARIGGDFYEAVRVPGAVRIMLGDVQGKGLGAVETASVLLGSFRAAVYEAPDLATLADQLDEGLARYGAWDPDSDAAERFATVVLVEFPDGEDTARLLSCGHPAPLLQHGAGVRPVNFADPSLPVNLAGLADSRHRIEQVPFGPGDRLLLYTDGVSETRDRAGTFYPLEPRMRRWAAEPAGKLPELLHKDLAGYGADGLDDDVAALLVVYPPGVR